MRGAGQTLAVRRVVLYRNGVAYVERSGHTAGDEVRIKLRPDDVQDFLATVAVTGASPVRAAAFTPPADTDKPRDHAGEHDLQTVVVSLDGRGRDVALSYVTAAPVWKPSYRLVVGQEGTATLQIWAVARRHARASVARGGVQERNGGAARTGPDGGF